MCRIKLKKKGFNLISHQDSHSWQCTIHVEHHLLQFVGHTHECEIIKNIKKSFDIKEKCKFFF